MAWRVLVEGVEEDVGVDGDHNASLSAARSENRFHSRELRLLLDRGIVQARPTEGARLGRLPVADSARFRRINAQNVFESAPGQLGQRNFPALADLPGTLVNVVRQLDLCARHAII